MENIEHALELETSHSVDSERALLSALITDQDAFDLSIEEGLIFDDFYDPANGKLFLAIYQLHAESKMVNTHEIYNKLLEMGKLESVGGAVYIAEIEALVPTSAHAKSYARLIHEKGILRRLISTATKIVEAAREQKGSFKEIINEAEASILALSDDAYKKGAVPIYSLILEASKRLDNMMEGIIPARGIASGFDGFDKYTYGLQPGELIILAARPSMGKTAFALNIASYVAIDTKIPVGFFTIEMNAQSLLQRIIGAEAGIDISKLKNAKLDPKDCTKLNDALAKISEGLMYIDESPTLNISEMRSKSRRLVKQHGVKFIIVDYLQLMTGSERHESKVYEVAEISRGLKGIARELNIPVLALSQLNRAVETRTDKKPLMSDLRDSGSLEQDADIVAFLYREEYYQRDKTPHDKKGIAECIVAKNRNGSTGSFEMRFASHLTKFSNIDNRSYEY